jgi:hypothetical protein
MIFLCYGYYFWWQLVMHAAVCFQLNGGVSYERRTRNEFRAGVGLA